ncbi:MAG: hypothetical protein ACI8UO_006459 [Verrucomicrobiales bacterium]|jgi:hypothetical protein
MASVVHVIRPSTEAIAEERLISSALANLRQKERVGRRSPFSIIVTPVLLTPARAASFSCDQPFSSRAALNSSTTIWENRSDSSRSKEPTVVVDEAIRLRHYSDWIRKLGFEPGNRFQQLIAGAGRLFSAIPPGPNRNRSPNLNNKP